VSRSSQLTHGPLVTSTGTVDTADVKDFSASLP